MPFVLITLHKGITLEYLSRSDCKDKIFSAFDFSACETMPPHGGSKMCDTMLMEFEVYSAAGRMRENLIRNPQKFQIKSFLTGSTDSDKAN